MEGILMKKNKEITVLSETVRVQRINREDFICLTDIAKFKNVEDPRFVIQNWMRTRPSVEFLGLWEVLNNPDFNRVEFDTVKNGSGSHAFVTIAPIRAKRNPGSCQPLLAEEEGPEIYRSYKALFYA